jgi:hypothetical protein
VTEYLKLYEEPQFDDEGNFKKDQLSEENINLKLQLPLKDGILKTNIGVPLVIVVNKSDVVLQTGERKRFEEDSEFILKHLRNFTLACKNNFNFRRWFNNIYFNKTKFKFKCIV